ncbi:MAG TPA: tetratricopeptide repeat protein [Candidatus Acidoferrales bacterium]|nr:tetratricopeptide repeat protein [Candidatus Acidoferrales bacterium]
MRFRIPKTLVLLGLALLSALARAAVNDPSPDALVEADHWKRARAALEPRVQANPNDAKALYLLSKVRVKYGDLDGAISLAEKAVALDGRSAEYQWQLAESVGEKADKVGGLSAFGLARRFKREGEKAMALDAKHVDSRFGMMIFHLRAPGIVGGDKKKAYALAEEIARISPSDGYFAQARMLREEKKSESPESYYLKALSADPRRYSTHIALVNFYFSAPQQKYDLVEKYAREAVKLEPGRTGGYGGQAIVFARQKRWKELDATLAQAEKNVPDNFTPFYNAGNILLADGSDLPRAEKYFRKYLTIEPEPETPTHADAHWRLALVLERMGRKPEAVQELEKALQLNPKLEGAKKDMKRLK